MQYARQDLHLTGQPSLSQTTYTLLTNRAYLQNWLALVDEHGMSGLQPDAIARAEACKVAIMLHPYNCELVTPPALPTLLPNGKQGAPVRLHSPCW